MDPHFPQLTNSVVCDVEFDDFPESYGFDLDDGTSSGLNQLTDIHNFAPLYHLSSDFDFSDDNESYPMLNYINKILMEEEQPSVCNDPIALQETEKSLYDVLANDFPSLAHEPLIEINQHVNGLDCSVRNALHDNVFCTTSSDSRGFLPFDSIEKTRSMFTDNETISLFNKGFEEGNKFLKARSLISVEEVQSSGRLSRKKHTDEGNVGRSSKHSAIYEEEVELSETFDKILLYREGKTHADVELLTQLGNKKIHHKGPNALSVDLIELLISCSQSVAANDLMAAREQLKLIKHHASSTGNSYQRLAIPFVKGLEARIEGTGPEIYSNLVSKYAPSSEELKAFRVFLSAPFKQIFCFFATSMILEAALKSTTLHIIDFGIGYGLQWPSLIKQLSDRPIGFKLRITGIDIPEPGFRPAERIESTGRRLAEYCKKFEVPFEYHTIASRNWDEINIEDLNLKRNEVLAVNCQWRFRSVLDETVEGGCPRDAVLNLIRDMKPDILVNDVINAQFRNHFFLTRFKEAIFFFSTIFDILDHILPQDDLHRLKYEMDYMGTDIVNIVACEGITRTDRPETYKQWQKRYQRAGFKLLPLKKTLMKELKEKVKEGYHKDFIFDDNGYWLMQGWKGKIITASSCLVPA